MPGGTAAAPEVFVYYRVEAAAEAEVCRRVGAAQRELQARFPGLHARLMRRDDAPDASPPAPTLMETYAVAPGAEAPALAGLLTAIEQAMAPLQPMCIGGRHVEVFRACA